jgi:hypothetical protein
MSRRGSAQLLLLSFRSRGARACMMGTIAAAIATVAFVRTSGEFALPAEMGIAKALRQSAWEHALARLPEKTPWPWAEKWSVPVSSVRQLGLSASLVRAVGSGADATFIEPSPAQDPHLAPSKRGGVNVGDRVTVTAADGSSRVYRVTGSKVVDPHLADEAKDVAVDSGSRGLCLPLDPLLAGSLQLVIQATTVEPKAPAETDPEL